MPMILAPLPTSTASRSRSTTEAKEAMTLIRQYVRRGRHRTGVPVSALLARSEVSA